MRFFRGLFGKLNNRVVVWFFEVLRKLQISPKKKILSNNLINEEAYRTHFAIIDESDGFIENQNAYSDMRYGKTTMKYAGCEIFATFNAIFDVSGKRTLSLPDMISEFEKDGMALGGRFGTSPKAIITFLRKQGFAVDFTLKESEFDSLGEKSASLILTMFNDKDDIFKQIHTVSISKAGGKFTAHNVYCNGSVVGPYLSIRELISHINNGKAKGICLIGIGKPLS